MSLHFRMKGRLVFGGEADATRLFATLSADPFLREALTLRGAAIVAAFDDFVSYAGPDLQTSTARLAEAAKQARSGRVLFRYEGETADWCIEAPPRVFGPKPKKNEHSERFGVVGELGFAEALEARAALDALVAVLGDRAALSVDGAALRANVRGKAPERAVQAARLALFDAMRSATSGAMTWTMMIMTTRVRAPARVHGEGAGPRAYCKVEGTCRYASTEERDAGAAGFAALGLEATPKDLRNLVVEGDLLVTKEGFEALIKALRAPLRTTKHGSFALESRWGFRRVGSSNRRR
ncbi:MAG: hypothetical protein JNL38_33635 [Myxococcales bacterium]|jgi:hypothetical protein|nr:hypothetical protein [Myxococcales bacterium]